MREFLLPGLSPEHRMSVESVVAILRRVHSLNAGHITADDAGLGARGSTSGSSAPSNPVSSGAENLTPVAQTLAGIHQARDASRRPGAMYEAVCKNFFGFQRQLNRQKMAMDRLLSGVFPRDDSSSPAAPIFQQSIQLQFPAGGVSGARFRCVNKTGSRKKVTFANESVRSEVAGVIDGASLAFQPSSMSLAADEAIVMQVTLDLTECVDLGTNPVEASADVVMDGETAMKLWISADVYTAPT